MALAIAVADALPSEFRIFKAGDNTTSHGSFLFDEQAAADVMAAYQAHGVDIMIDLEHLSVEDPQSSANFDPDARGWCKLEVRSGELWAVEVSWTADGAARLKDKRQRYISPVFAYNAETRRVEEMLNIAMTALPATDKLTPLVAASRRGNARDMRKLSAGASFSEVACAIQDELAERDPYAYVCEIYDASVIYDSGGKLWELPYTFDGVDAVLGALPVQVKRTYSPVAVATPAAQPAIAAASRRQKLAQGEPIMSPEQLAQLADVLGLGSDATVEDVIATVAAMVKKITDAANGTPPADAPAEAPPAAAASAEPMVAAARIATAAAVLVRLTGKKEIGEVIREIEAWKKSHVDLETQRAALAAERATLEVSERRRLVAALVTLGSEIPATAWADDGATQPAEPWASMPIEALRARVQRLTAAKGTAAPPAGSKSGPRIVPAPSADTGGQVVMVDGEAVELTAKEVAACTAAKAKPETYARNKLIRQKAQRQRSA